MINTMAYMLIIALSGFVRLRTKYDRIWSWLMLFAAVYLFVIYQHQTATEGVIGFSFLWNRSQIGDITIDFHPAAASNELITPLFFVSLLTILNNNIFRSEERRSVFNSCIILNFMALSLLICAENYVQLITMVFISDILGYLVLKDADSSRRYVIYNFFADMCLFMILTLACGKIQSLELNRLLGYEQIGRHKDFVGVITAVALFVKMGCFLFQSYLLDISSGRFLRMSTVNLLFSPFCGILILLKLHNLMIVSSLVEPLFSAMAGLTFISGLLGFILQKNIQKKLVNLNMTFMGLLMYLLQLSAFDWYSDLSLYYIAAFLFNQLFFKIYLYQNRETDVSRMLNGREINRAALMNILVQICMLNTLFALLLYHTSEKLHSAVSEVAGALILIGICIVLNHIYRSPHSRRLDYLNPNRFRGISFAVNDILLLAGFFLFRGYLSVFPLIFIVFPLIILSPIGKVFRRFYEIQKLQNNDLSKKVLSGVVVAPISYLSRTLWLMVDLFLSEKIITASLSKMGETGVSLFLKLNRRSFRAYILFIVLGIAAFVVSWYRRGLP